MVMATGCSKTKWSTPSTLTSISTYFDAGTVTVMFAASSTAPAGTTSVAPPAVMVPPSGVISADDVADSEEGHSTSEEPTPARSARMAELVPVPVMSDAAQAAMVIVATVVTMLFMTRRRIGNTPRKSDFSQ